jgi:cysteine desulfurase
LAQNQDRNRNTVMIYLDHNATSPLLPQARTAWLEASERYPGNPSSPHRLGARADAALDNARQRLGALLGCSPLDIVWTSGATEACNTVLQHAAHAGDAAASVWLGAIEHPAVLEGARPHFPGRVQHLPVDERGVVDLEALRQRLARSDGERPALVALMAANNETGVLQPWREVQQLCAARGVSFFCDATQWCGRLPAKGLGACEFVAGSAHKFGGPRGVGFLKCPASPGLHPLLRGGKQQEGRRAGTENVPGVLAMLAALEFCEQQIAAGGHERRRGFRDTFERELQRALPAAGVTGSQADRLWNTVHVVMPEADCRQRWVVKLDKAGFAVSTGSACASGSEHPSHVLTAMGLSPGEAARALRFSSGWLTPESDWTALLNEVVRIQDGFASDQSHGSRGAPAAQGISVD